MSEYAVLGHMSLAAPLPTGSDRPVCYLPHHGLLRGEGEEAKIRVVFNGSARTTDGISLNDCFHIGPDLLPSLTDVIIASYSRRISRRCSGRFSFIRTIAIGSKSCGGRGER